MACLARGVVLAVAVLLALGLCVVVWRMLTHVLVPLMRRPLLAVCVALAALPTVVAVRVIYRYATESTAAEEEGEEAAEMVEAAEA